MFHVFHFLQSDMPGITCNLPIMRLAHVALIVLVTLFPMTFPDFKP